ncbi:MAG: MBL fold metallo-hydrolase [Ponticaulis sp.]|nr:MBL fold metallo-hydrolase [Ponticaulis sp.]|tara:strand:- start:50222 stop:51175 length:954 start_codon:yes stop_codon:yes gene_type:complete
MKNLSLLSTSAIALLLAACAPEDTPAPEPEETEAAAPTPTPEPTPTPSETASSDDVVPFSIGSLDAYALRDGGFTMPIAQSPFAAEQSVDDIADALGDAGLDTDMMSLALHPMLVKTEGGVLLFDTGTGGPPAGGLMESLTAADVAPADITDIFISHSHFDHVGGLAKEGELAFPNATIRMTTAEWAFMKANEDQADLVGVVESAVETFEPGSEVVPGIVTAVAVEGHTPGHSAYRVASDDDTVLYVGDAMHHFVISVGYPGWKIAFDTDEPAARAAREALLSELAETGETIFAYHFPFPGIGHIDVSGDSYIYVED